MSNIMSTHLQAGHCPRPKRPGVVCALRGGPPQQWMPPAVQCAAQATLLPTQTALPASPAPRALTAAPGDPASAPTASLGHTHPPRYLSCNILGKSHCYIVVIEAVIACWNVDSLLQLSHLCSMCRENNTGFTHTIEDCKYNIVFPVMSMSSLCSG